MSKTRVAVLMSAYNGEKYIEEQIDSILAQRGDLEVTLWVRDDGSSDQTTEILGRYADEGKLRWYAGRNLGPGLSFLDLICHCRGYDYYAFSDQDDYWEPDKLERALLALGSTEKPRLYFSNAEIVDEQLQALGSCVYSTDPILNLPTLSCYGGVLGCTIVFNAALALLIQERELPAGILMHDFYVALLCKSVGGKILYDQQPSIKYRQHRSNAVGVSYNLLTKLRERFRIISKNETYGIAAQAELILTQYRNLLTPEAENWLMHVASYRKHLWNRLALACSSRTRYISWNMSITMRLSILLGRR